MSTCLDLPDRVRQYIRDKYDKEYLGNLIYTVNTVIITPLNLYVLSWGLNQETYPFIMQGEFTTEEQFYNYVIKQVGYTRFFETKRFIAYRIGKPAIEADHYIDPLLKFDSNANRKL